MKANTYFEKIKKENACSIHTAEMLTKALHREGKLDEKLVVRFRPLFADFDIIAGSYEKGNFRAVTEPMNIDELKTLIDFTSKL